ncbi:MAG: TolC family protein [Saprospiraceae bacterium]|nr:TolC family protein [Saprospiraceae bacterium]
MKYLLCLLYIGLASIGVHAQTSSSITIVLDGDRGSSELLEQIQAEVAILLPEYDLTYNVKRLDQSDNTMAELIEEGLEDESMVLITLGFTSSSSLISRNSYPKPSIAGFSLQRLDAESTGIENFTFIQSPFSIQQDFETFQSIFPFQHLGVFILPSMQAQVAPFVRSFSKGFDIQFIPISDDVDYDMEQLNPNVDAIYVLPNLYNKQEQYQALINKINEANLPSFSLIGRDDVEKGVLASVAPSNFLSVYARRIALNVMKVFDGENPKDFPIQISGVENDFVINVETMERLKIFPPFEVLSQASLINLEPKIGIEYSLESAIAQAIQHNLSYQSASQNVDLQNTEIGIARSNVLPDVTANSSVVTLDGSSAEFLKAANQLTPQTEWTANLQLTQLIYSQPAWANVAIQKSLLRSEELGLLSQQLDLVQDVCSSYINLLLAQANLNIQNSNIQTTLSNLNIAKTKAKIGTVSNADVYGFESQLAQNKTLMNDARTAREQARIAFNQLLNRPLDEEFVLSDIKNKTDLLFLQDKRIFDRINNHYDFRKFADFLINYAFENAPEIEQLDWVIRAQEQSLQSNQLSRFLPQIGMQGSWNKSMGRYGTRTSDETFQALGVDPKQATWNVGVNASLPIFQGFLRNKRIQKDKISLEQLRINKDLLKQSFATNIRISLENLGNSYNDIQFTQQAEEASGKYLKMVQDLYREGAINIVTLLDAQNNALGAQLGAISSRYQFINDAIIIERLFNNIYILKNQDERESFINEYLTYLIKKDNNE